MRYTKPQFYDSFQCLADTCPDTCCAGWQIVIDEDSLERYSRVKGAFGHRLANSIDWEEGVFCQYERRCAFLNEQNFCDIYGELGKDALCDTCRMYPRHVEEYDGLRELSLSLSCPEAARILLTEEAPMELIGWETEEEEDSFEEDEMDFLLFTWLEDAREVMFEILRDRSLEITHRMALVGQLAEEIQHCLDEEREFEIDHVIRRYETKQGDGLYFGALSLLSREEVCRYGKPDHGRRCREYAVFGEMELLRPQWGPMMEDLWSALYRDGKETYEEICSRFDKEYGGTGPRAELWNRIGEHLMMFFVYTYFCGAVYDGWVAHKIRLALFSVCWIQELVRYRWLKQDGLLTMEDVIRMSWYYAREVEHSDVNLNILEEWLDEHWDEEI